MRAAREVNAYLIAKGIKSCMLDSSPDSICRACRFGDGCEFFQESPLECLLGKHIVKLVENHIKIE